MQKLTLLLLLLVLQLAMYGKGDKNMSLSQRPLSFLENKGQLFDQQGKPRTDIDFILYTKDLTLFIGKGTLQYQFVKREGLTPTALVDPGGQPPAKASPITTYRLDVNLEGADTSATIVTDDKRKEEFRYYIGNASPDGITDVHAYGKVTYKDIYPGIDWVLYTKDGQLKYDFVVHPAGKIADIRMRYEGADKMSIEKDGSLVITTPLGNVEEAAPYSYELESNKEVQSSYKLAGNLVSFTAATYNGALIIDPTVQWGTYFGGMGEEIAYSMAIDTAGYVYISGITTSTSSLATSGAHQQTYGGGFYDAYLAKFDSTGQLQWATYYGGGGSVIAGLELSAEVSCDRFGNIYVAGTTGSESGIATPGSFQDTFGYPSDFYSLNGFLVQFNNDGIRQWGTYYGDNRRFYIFALACDDEGNVYAAGHIDSGNATGYDLVTTGVYQTQYGGGTSDALLVKFDSGGNRLWATYFGGENLESPSSVICDEAGDVYMGGITYSLSGIASETGYLQNADYAVNNGFMVKFSGDEGSLDWSTYIPGIVSDLYLDPFHHLYLVGTTGLNGPSGSIDTTIVTPGCWQYLSLGGPFLMSFNPDDCTRNWGTYYGGNYLRSITGNSQGHIYIAGETHSPDLEGNYPIATPGSYQDTLSNEATIDNGDAFIAQFDTSGMRQWGTYYAVGGSTLHKPDILCDFTGALYMHGDTKSSAHTATPGVHQEVLNGPQDAFLVRWLPVDIGMERVMPGADTLCTGDISLTVQVSNNGRVDKTDDVVITYTYTGPTEGEETLTFTGGLLAGAAETYTLGTLPLTVEGAYDITIYLHYTRDDHERGNDTLHFTLGTTTAEPVATIAYNQVGTNYQFSNPDGLSSYDYYWDFGDGATSTEATPTHAYATSGTYEVMLVVTGWCGTDTAYLSLDAVGNGSGIAGTGVDQLLTVYPNPVSGVLSIKAAALILKGYEVRNVLGQQVMKGSLSGATDKIDVSGLVPGTYYIRIDTDKGLVEKPFQVIR